MMAFLFERALLPASESNVCRTRRKKQDDNDYAAGDNQVMGLRERILNRTDEIKQQQQTIPNQPVEAVSRNTNQEQKEWRNREQPHWPSRTQLEDLQTALNNEHSAQEPNNDPKSIR